MTNYTKKQKIIAVVISFLLSAIIKEIGINFIITFALIICIKNWYTSYCKLLKNY